MLQPGAYKADKDGWDGYELTVDIKVTFSGIKQNVKEVTLC